MTIELPQLPFEITVKQIDIINVRDDFGTKTCLVNFLINNKHTYAFDTFEYKDTWTDIDVMEYINKELNKHTI